MIDSYIATYIIIAFLFVWAILIPIAGVIPKVKEIISYRYLIVVVFLACSIGVIINFGELDSNVRVAVLIGSMVISCIYIIIRSVEKAFWHGWIERPHMKASVSKGDLNASIELDDKKVDKQ